MSSSSRYTQNELTEELQQLLRQQRKNLSIKEEEIQQIQKNIQNRFYPQVTSQIIRMFGNQIYIKKFAKKLYYLNQFKIQKMIENNKPNGLEKSQSSTTFPHAKTNLKPPFINEMKIKANYQKEKVDKQQQKQQSNDIKQQKEKHPKIGEKENHKQKQLEKQKVLKQQQKYQIMNIQEEQDNTTQQEKKSSKIKYSSGEQALRKECQSQNQFLQTKVKLDRMVFLEDMISCISQLVGKRKGEAIAKTIYEQQNKKNIKTNKLDKLYSQCLKQGVQDIKIQKIKQLVSLGKKNAVFRQLINQFGQINGKKLYQMAEKDIPYKPAFPVIGSSLIRKKNGIDIMRYQSILSQTDKQQAKNVLVLGQTGCGKSTFINSLVNYLLRVEIDDPFRYYLIVENQENQMNSITQTITDYYIKDSMSGDVYRFIDTPGFGDTKGLSFDNKIIENITNKFKTDLQTIHCVFFVMKSTNTRVGVYQKYIFDSVMDLFDKTIAPNFVFILTFSDSGVPLVLDHVKQKEKGFGRYWNQIVEPKFIKVNSCGIFQKIDPSDKINMGYWEISNLSIKSLFTKINSIQAKSMSLSKQLINKKSNLQIQIKAAFRSLQRSINNRYNLERYIEMIIQFARQMDEKKYFQKQIYQSYWQQVTYRGNVTRCTMREECMKLNCHIGCSANDSIKQNCSVMKKGYCTVCYCHWKRHINTNKIFKQKWRPIKVTLQVMEKMYGESKKDKTISQTALQDKLQLLLTEIRNIVEASTKMQKLRKQLSSMQLSDKKPQSTKTHLQCVLREEEKEQRPGYLNKIKQLKQMINLLGFYEQIARNNPDEKNQISIFEREIKKQFSRRVQKNMRPNQWNIVKKIFE